MLPSPPLSAAEVPDYVSHLSLHPPAPNSAENNEADGRINHSPNGCNFQCSDRDVIRLNRENFEVCRRKGESLLQPGMSPKVVWDWGMGNGHWGQSLAQEDPSTDVTCFDDCLQLRNRQDGNLKCQSYEIDEDWPVGRVDMINIRHMKYKGVDWDKIYGRAHDKLNSGGWLQHTEAEAQTPAWKEFESNCGSYLLIQGSVLEGICDLFSRANFVDVGIFAHVVKGSQVAKSIRTRLALSLPRNTTPDEILSLAHKMSMETALKRDDTVLHCYTIWGRKP